MSVEHFYEEEKKKRERISEKEIKENILKKLEHQKEKDKLLKKLEKDKKLSLLRSVVEMELIKPEITNKVIDWLELEASEINDILSVVDAIAQISNVDLILPPELRISKEDYLNAVNDSNYRSEVITKLDAALDHLYMLSHPFSWSVFDMFSWLLFALDLNLVKIQEYTIEIKNSLVALNNNIVWSGE